VAGVDRPRLPQGLDLGLVQLGQCLRVVDPGAAAFRTVGIPRDGGDDVGGGLPDRPLGVGDPEVWVGRGGEKGGEALAGILERWSEAVEVGGRGLHAVPPE
jgi:hypothetical protein